MNVDELPDESDSSDEDYVPNEKPEELPSEEEEDDPISDSEDVNSRSKKGKATKKKKGRRKNETEEATKTETGKEAESETKKSNIDDIWADFVKDTGFKSKNSISKPESSKPKQTNTPAPIETNTSIKKAPDKVKITQIFEFAGEEVKVEKEVAANSAEARLLGEKASNSNSKIKRTAGLSGIGNVLNQLTKKPKISTLEKTKLDWDSYKRDHNLEEELETFNKGKDGYLERQDFLQRTDLRRFDIERSIREVERNKRFNNTL